MLSVQTLPFLYQKWRVPKTIAKLQVQCKKTGVQMEVTADTSDATMHIKKEDETSEDKEDNGSTQDGNKDEHSITTP